MTSAHFVVRFSRPDRQRMSAELFSAHVAYLRALHDSGRMLLCGPCEDQSAIYVIRCADREEAERLVAEEPFVLAGLFQDTSILAFTPATPENDFLSRNMSSKSQASKD